MEHILRIFSGLAVSFFIVIFYFLVTKGGVPMTDVGFVKKR